MDEAERRAITSDRPEKATRIQHPFHRREHADREAKRERQEQARDEPHVVVERQPRDHPVVCGERHAFVERSELAVEHRCGDGYRLLRSRRAARELDEERVFVVAGYGCGSVVELLVERGRIEDGRIADGFAELRGHARVGDDEARAEAGDDSVHVAPVFLRVHLGCRPGDDRGDHPSADRAEERSHEQQRVRHQQGDALAGFCSVNCEGGCGSACSAAKLGEGHLSMGALMAEPELQCRERSARFVVGEGEPMGEQLTRESGHRGSPAFGCAARRVRSAAAPFDNQQLRRRRRARSPPSPAISRRPPRRSVGHRRRGSRRSSWSRSDRCRPARAWCRCSLRLQESGRREH